MAKIPVEEKKGGAPWLLWLLGLALLAGLIWFLAEAFDNEPEVAEVEPVPTVVEPLPEVTGPITSLETILDSQNPEALVGRAVNLSGVTASAVTGDSTYWVYNPDEGIEQRVFVVLYGLEESQPGPGTGADGVYDVDVSENMGLEGVIQRVGPSDPDAWAVTDEDAREITENQVYIRALNLMNLESSP